MRLGMITGTLERMANRGMLHSNEAVNKLEKNFGRISKVFADKNFADARLTAYANKKSVGAFMKGAKEQLGMDMDNRLFNIAEKRAMNADTRNNFVTRNIVNNNNKYVRRAGSLLINGETGMVSKKRIAGLAAAGYVATPDGDRR